jgi:hypothetical protein
MKTPPRYGEKSHLETFISFLNTISNIDPEGIHRVEEIYADELSQNTGKISLVDHIYDVFRTSTDTNTRDRILGTYAERAEGKEVADLALHFSAIVKGSTGEWDLIRFVVKNQDKWDEMSAAFAKYWAHTYRTDIEKDSPRNQGSAAANALVYELYEHQWKALRYLWDDKKFDAASYAHTLAESMQGSWFRHDDEATFVAMLSYVHARGGPELVKEVNRYMAENDDTNTTLRKIRNGEGWNTDAEKASIDAILSKAGL